MTRYKRIIKTENHTVVIETHFTTLYLGLDDEPARAVSDQAFQDANYLWQLVLKKIGDEEVVDDYTIITTSSMEYKIKAWTWGSSILYRQLSSKHYKVAYNYIIYDAVSVIGWMNYFGLVKKEGV